MNAKKNILFLTIITVFLLLLSVTAFASSNPDIQRFGGSDRFNVAVNVSKAAYPNGTSNVIIANGYDNKLSDALTSTPLAKALNAPILLVNIDTIPAVTSQEIARLKPTHIYIIGGTGSVSQNIEANLKKNYSVMRIGGADRYEVSKNVADMLKGIVKSFKEAYVVNGYKYADALAVAPIATKEGSPILYVSSNVDNYTTNTANYIKSLGIAKIYTIGGSASISQNVINALNAERIDGKNRTEIAISIASRFYQNIDGIFIVNGYCPADALALGPYAVRFNQPILYIESGGSTVDSQVNKYIIANRTNIKSVSIAGGDFSVKSIALNTILNNINGIQPTPMPNPTPQPIPQPQPAPVQRLTGTLKYGMSGQQVRLLQTYLNRLGYSISVDGIFGPQTLNAVRNFQAKYGLAVDGIVGPQTAQKIMSILSTSTGGTPTPHPTLPPLLPGSLKGKIVFVDPGHGGSDPGTVNDGYPEKTLNLSVGLKLKDLLQKAGATVIMSRDSDITVGLYDIPAKVNSYIIGLELTKARGEINSIQQNINALNAQLNTLTSQQKQLQQDIVNKTAQRDAAKKALDDYNQNTSNQQNGQDPKKAELEKALNDAQAALDNAQKQLDSVNQQIQNVNAQITSNTKDLTTKNAYVNKLSYVKSEFDSVKNVARRPKSGIFSLVNGSINPDLAWVFDVEKNYQNNIIFVSIHGNSSGSTTTSLRGTEVYYQTDNTPTSAYDGYTSHHPVYDAAKRGTLAQDILTEVTNAINFNARGTFSKDLCVLRESNVVSVLVELGYLNNPQDRTLLEQSITQEKAAIGLYNGIIKYFSQQ